MLNRNPEAINITIIFAIIASLLAIALFAF